MLKKKTLFIHAILREEISINMFLKNMFSFFRKAKK